MLRRQSLAIQSLSYALEMRICLGAAASWLSSSEARHDEEELYDS